MTKHTYQDPNLTGVVVLGQYDGDIRVGLRRFRDPFENVNVSPEKCVYADHVMHRKRVPVVLTVSHEGTPAKPEKILASALGQTESVDETALRGYLDTLLRSTGIRELDSAREQFEAEPFRGWASVSRQM